MYTEKDLYDGMMIIWTKSSYYTDGDVYKWDATNHTVTSNRGKNSPCKGYFSDSLLKCMNDGVCRPEIIEFVPLIFN